jgi:hypothetical protein
MEQTNELTIPLVYHDSKIYITCQLYHTFLKTFVLNGIQILSPLVIVIDDKKCIQIATLDTILGSIVTETSCIGFHEPIVWNDVDISLYESETIIRDLQILNRNREPNLKDIINICSHYATRYSSPMIGRDIFTIFKSLDLGVQLIEKTFAFFCAITPTKPKIVVICNIQHCKSIFSEAAPQMIILNISDNLHNLDEIIALKRHCIKMNVLILSTQLGHNQLNTIINNMTKENLFALIIKNQPSIIWDIIRKIFLYNKHIINNIK